MPVGDLLDHLSEVLVDGDDRLRAIVRSSYALLDDDEAAVYRRFAVLDGPAGLPLDQAGGLRRPDRARPRRPHSCASSRRAGLLAVDRTGARWRYQQDDDLHRFARELLVEHGEEAMPRSIDSPTRCARHCPTTHG